MRASPVSKIWKIKKHLYSGCFFKIVTIFWQIDLKYLILGKVCGRVIENKYYGYSRSSNSTSKCRHQCLPWSPWNWRSPDGEDYRRQSCKQNPRIKWWNRWNRWRDKKCNHTPMRYLWESHKGPIFSCCTFRKNSCHNGNSHNGTKNNEWANRCSHSYSLSDTIITRWEFCHALLCSDRTK